MLWTFQHDANIVVCDSELSSQLKSATYSALRKMTGDIQDETPTLMSGAGHDFSFNKGLSYFASLSTFRR